MLEISNFIALAAIIYLLRKIGILSSRLEALEKTVERINDKVD